MSEDTDEKTFRASCAFSVLDSVNVLSNQKLVKLKLFFKKNSPLKKRIFTIFTFKKKDLAFFFKKLLVLVTLLYFFHSMCNMATFTFGRITFELSDKH